MVVPVVAQPAASSVSTAQRTFYVQIDQQRGTLVLPSSEGAGDGSLARDDGSVASIEAGGIGSDGHVSVHVMNGSTPAWLRARIVEGVLVGRWAPGTVDDPPLPAAFQGHVTGWNQSYFDRAGDARVFDLTTATGQYATLRIDRLHDGSGTPVGRWKTYGSAAGGAADEGPELDLVMTEWDGDRLAFQLNDGTTTRSCVAQINGRLVAGSCTPDGAGIVFGGARSEVLAYGLSARTATGRSSYQHRTRAMLRAIMMDGDPQPIAVAVESSGAAEVPFRGASLPARDDDPGSHPQDYTRRELVIHETFADPYGGPNFVRDVHAWMTIPAGTPPAGGFPAVVAVNGHGGSALQLMDPGNEEYWYGDAYARRGRVVLAVDVSHRPLADRAVIYTDAVVGDDPAAGNGPHPAIHYAGLDSSWEEDGERAADATTARHLLAALSFVDPARTIVTGLSMGGETTTYAAALDPGFSGAVPAGFSPDLGVMSLHGNHPCWMWQHASTREYLGVSDLHALIAPRPLVVETGRTDWVFSSLPAPFAADKQVLRRSRAAYGADVDALAHYLHYDVHHYHVGDVDPVMAVEQGVRVPLEIAADASLPIAWQSDPSTSVLQPNLFSFLDAKLPPPAVELATVVE